MADKSFEFAKESEKMASDNVHYKKKMDEYVYYRQFLTAGKEKYSDYELEKSRAFNIRNKAFKNYDKLLVDFETNFIKNGGKVIWACNADEALESVVNILKENNLKNIVKSDNSVIDEINLYDILIDRGFNVEDLDINEYLLKLAADRTDLNLINYDNKTSADVSQILSKKLKKDFADDAPLLLEYVTDILKDKIYAADTIITGADFLVSDDGSVVITENEGNIIKAISRADVHIIIAGIDKVIPSFNDLNVLLPLSKIYDDAIDNCSSMISIINNNTDYGKKHKLYLILLDNGRSEVFAEEKQKTVLTCLHCGACQKVCPITNIISKSLYENSNYGPVGTVLIPLINKSEDYSHYCNLCTSCGQCEDVCPMNISFRELIFSNRLKFAKKESIFTKDGLLYYFISNRLKNRKNMEKGGYNMKNKELRMLLGKTWGVKREIPVFAENSFSQYWKKLNGLEK